MPQETQAPYEACIGFDVSKDSITAYHSGTGLYEDLENNSKALRRYMRTLDIRCLAVCEPTGGYEALLLTVLSDHHIPAHRADARKVKAFIRSLGIHGKSDSIDAKALALYGQERQARLPLWQPRLSAQQELAALVARRQDLILLRTAEKNRLQAPAVTDRVKRSCGRLIKLIEQEIRELHHTVQTLIANDDHLNRRNRTLTAITGIGSVVAANLLAAMPELGTLSRRQAASLAGLAPHPRQSGKYDGYRRTPGGRPEVKHCLFMAALAAAKHDKKSRSFYLRLISNGKKPIVAITALMRKIITIANAKIRDRISSQQLS